MTNFLSNDSISIILQKSTPTWYDKSMLKIIWIFLLSLFFINVIFYRVGLKMENGKLDQKEDGKCIAKINA